MATNFKLSALFGFLLLTGVAHAVDSSQSPQSQSPEPRTEKTTQGAFNAYIAKLASQAQLDYAKASKTDQAKQDQYLAAIYDQPNTLTPAQIKALNNFERQIELAKHAQQPFKKERKVITYNDDQPPTIYIGKSRLSTISFVDNAGNPYPIQNYEVSDTSYFDISQRSKGDVLTDDNDSQPSQSSYNQNQKIQPSYLDAAIHQEPKKQQPEMTHKKSKALPPSMLNAITVRGQSIFADGDLIIYLVGRQNPIHIFLSSSDTHYDYQTNIMVDGLTAQSLSSISVTGQQYDKPSHTMMGFLNGTPPKSAQVMDISLPQAQVWHYGKYYYIRTQSILQSPAYLSKVATGTFNLYQIDASSHVINVVDHGQLKTAYIREPVTMNSSVAEQMDALREQSNNTNSGVAS